MEETTCDHLTSVESVRATRKYECVECVKVGAGWVHLRTCQACGKTHCCDQSPNRHARRHSREWQHDVVSSAEPGERWLYCYTDDVYRDY